MHYIIPKTKRPKFQNEMTKREKPVQMYGLSFFNAVSKAFQCCLNVRTDKKRPHAPPRGSLTGRMQASWPDVQAASVPAGRLLRRALPPADDVPVFFPGAGVDAVFGLVQVDHFLEALLGHELQKPFAVAGHHFLWDVAEGVYTLVLELEFLESDHRVAIALVDGVVQGAENRLHVAGQPSEVLGSGLSHLVDVDVLEHDHRIVLKGKGMADRVAGKNPIQIEEVVIAQRFNAIDPGRVPWASNEASIPCQLVDGGGIPFDVDGLGRASGMDVHLADGVGEDASDRRGKAGAISSLSPAKGNQRRPSE